MSIAERFADAAVMFWQSLDAQEKRMLALGVAYVTFLVVSAPLERNRKQRERDELAEAVALRLRHG